MSSVTAWARRLESALDRRVLSPGDFGAALQAIGITRGATVMIHSSMDAVNRRVPGLGPVRLIRLLQDLVGRDGTLVLPTFPFEGLQYEYVRSQPVFDVVRTPSRVGLLTEVFRRSPGVIRSLHPTHSVAAWGARSRELVADHHLGTAFGETSPLYKLRQCGGLVTAIGVPPELFSVFHVVEELHPTTRARQYGAERFEMTIVEPDRRTPYWIVPLRPDGHRGRGRAVRALVREGTIRRHAPAGLTLAVADADRLFERSWRLVDEGGFEGD